MFTLTRLTLALTTLMLSLMATGQARQTPTKPLTPPRPIKVVAAEAERLSDNSVRVVVQTETPTAGWRIQPNHTISDNQLHLWVRGVAPRGATAQVITTKKIEATIPNVPAQIEKVIVHSQDAEITVPIQTVIGETKTAEPLQKSADDMVVEAQRLLSVQGSSGDLKFDGRRTYSEPEIQLLMALYNLKETARLYLDVVEAVSDESAQRAAAKRLLDHGRQCEEVLRLLPDKDQDALETQWSVLKVQLQQQGSRHGVSWERWILQPSSDSKSTRRPPTRPTTPPTRPAPRRP